jgi:hypothetical protein
VAELVDALFLDDGRKQDFGIGSNPVLTTNVIRLTAKNGINEEYHKWLQTLMIYKWVNSIITLNSQVAELVYAGEYDTNMSGLEITNTNFLAHG